MALTTLSSVVAVVTVPLIDRFFTLGSSRWRAASRLGSTPAGVILGQLLVMRALPVAAGMAMRRAWPEQAIRWLGPLRRTVFVAIGVLLLLVVQRDAGEFVRNLRLAVPMAVAFVVVAFGVGWLSARALGGSPGDCFTFGSEFSTRNVAVATAIAMSFAGRPEYAIFATAYFMIEMSLLLGAAALFRRHFARV